jgi:hypothetical protein
MRTFHHFVKGFLNIFELGIPVAATLLVTVAIVMAGGASARTPCSIDKPGACFEPVPDGFMGAIVDAELEGVLVVIPVSPDSNFEQILPNGTRRIHQSVSGVPLFYCPDVVSPDCVAAPFIGEGRVNADVVELEGGGAVCPSVVHIRGQVVDPDGRSFDVDAALVVARREDAPEDCRLVTLEVGAEPS